ncbi:MAG: lipopolysaccharide biosynthesis protein [bacterium]
MNISLISKGGSFARLVPLILTPAAILFLATNIANVANLAFNMIFARILGPELFADLAFLMTLKLSAMTLLMAVQMGVAKTFAHSDNRYTPLFFIASKARKFALNSIVLVLILFFLGEGMAKAFSIDDSLSLFILFMAIPTTLPLSLYRGLAQAKLDHMKLAASLQVEWIIRLFGGLLLWYAGVGIPGIILALVLSLYAGTFFATSSTDRFTLTTALPTKIYADSLWKLSLPFLAVQFAQILILDGDIIIAKYMFAEKEAGLFAGLALIQRIFFFAFLSFSTILLPVVAKLAKVNGEDAARKECQKMIIMVLLMAIIPMFLLYIKGELVTSLLLGASYTDIAPLMFAAGVTGLAFTISHLCVTYLIASGSQRASWMIATFAMLQMACLTLFALNIENISVTGLMIGKLLFQLSMVIAILIITFRGPVTREVHN